MYGLRRFRPLSVFRLRLNRRSCRQCAPLAQLDRAPDYESGGQEFESLRARQSPAKVGTIARAGFSSAETVFRSWSFGPQMRMRSLPTVTLLTNMCNQVRRKDGSASRSRCRTPEEKRCTMSGGSSVRSVTRWRRASGVDVPSRICSLARPTRVLSSATPASMASQRRSSRVWASVTAARWRSISV